MSAQKKPSRAQLRAKGTQMRAAAEAARPPRPDPTRLVPTMVAAAAATLDTERLMGASTAPTAQPNRDHIESLIALADAGEDYAFARIWIWVTYQLRGLDELLPAALEADIVPGLVDLLLAERAAWAKVRDLILAEYPGAPHPLWTAMLASLEAETEESST